MPAPAAPIVTFTGSAVVVEPMSAMRRKIAERMVASKQTSAHVTSVFEIDLTNVARLRDRVKDRFAAQYGTKLTYMPFVFRAAITALKARPLLNASISGDEIVYHREINLGMAVALDWGLIVPVIRRADDLSLVGLARAANDLAERARTKKLSPDEVAGGTFTITNHGGFGSLFATPVINQPQVGILGVGAIEKRPKVVTMPDGSDTIAVRTMGYVGVTFDHRLVDGAEGRHLRERREERRSRTSAGPSWSRSDPVASVVSLLSGGRVSYDAALLFQREAEVRVKAGGRETLFLLEHADVITVGRNAARGDLLVSEEFLRQRGVALRVADRGGRLTFHGPGQLVAYPVLDLSRGRRDVRRYVRDLEEVLIRTAGDFGVRGLAELRPGEKSLDLGRKRQAGRDRRPSFALGHDARRRLERLDGPGKVFALHSVRDRRRRRDVAGAAAGSRGGAAAFGGRGALRRPFRAGFRSGTCPIDLQLPIRRQK